MHENHPKHLLWTDEQGQGDMALSGHSLLDFVFIGKSDITKCYRFFYFNKAFHYTVF